MKLLKRLSIAIALAALLTAGRDAAAADWTITDLGGLPDFGHNAGGIGINDYGQVVGSDGPIDDRFPVLFDNGTAQNLGTLGGIKTKPGGDASGQAQDINNNGVVVGDALTADGYSHAFSYSNGVMTDLGTLGGNRSDAYAINDSGTIVGRSETANGTTHAFVYSNGVMTDIGQGAALGVNNLGDVVGAGPTIGHSFLYKDGATQDLGDNSPYAINDSGLIVGSTLGNTLADVRAAYYQDGSWHSIGTLGGVSSFAYAVNNRDQIVGDSNTASGGLDHGFFYSNGVMQDVNSLIDPASGWRDLYAIAINDLGQITGSGIIDGNYHAFLLTPTMSTFELDVTYSDLLLNPLVVGGAGNGLPGEVSAKFILEGIAGSPGTFLTQDVVSALVNLGDGVWTPMDLSSFNMTLGPGGVNDIQTLSYTADPLVTPTGQQLTLHNNAFQLHIDGVDPSGTPFEYFYPDSTQALSVVPEPSSLFLASLAAVGIFARRRRRAKR